MRRPKDLLVVAGAVALLAGPGCGNGGKATGSAGTGGAAGSGTGMGTGTGTGTGATASIAASTGTGTGGAGGLAGTTSSTSTSTTGTTTTGTGGATATPQPCPTSPCLNVVNACPFPLWIHAADNAGVVLTPDGAMLPTGSVQQYSVPASWPAARVNAFWVDPTGPAPDPTAYDKVELTVGAGSMNYNITYVDYLALPSKMEAVDPACPKTATFDPAVACTVPVGSVLGGCPAGLVDGKRCLSAGIYCSVGQNQASAYCHALDAPLAACETQAPATCGIAAQLGDGTPQVYSCSGYFDSQQPGGCTAPGPTCHVDGNEWCAALNRGTLAEPTSVDTTQFYQTPPYNTYAKWVHDTCPGIYAFAYDDYPSNAGQSGYRSCTAARLDITFCPGG